MIRFLQQDSPAIKIVFWAIIVIVAGFMVITLVPGIFSGSPGDGSSTYATVRSGGYFGRYFTSNTEVSATQVQRLASRMLQQQKLPDMLMPYAMRRASDSLVQEAVLSYEADRLGLLVTDADLRNELQKGSFAEYLFPEGKYVGDDRYANFVSMAFNMSVPEFERTMKRELAISRLQGMVTSGVTVSDADVRKEYMEQGTKVKFDYAFFTQDDVARQINPSDNDLASFFQSHAKQYANAVPETRKLEYAILDPNNVPGGNSKPSDADLHAYYQQHSEQYAVKEQVKVRHILIKVPQGADPATEAALKKKAESIRQQIVAGGDFAKLAQENSDDPGSKATGGELGWIQHGTTVPEFDKAAFALNPGQTSDVVKSEFGYHIIQTEQKQAAHSLPFEQVRAQIEPLLTREMQMKATKAAAQKFADQAKSGGLDKVVAANHLQMQTTEYLGQHATVPGIPDGAPMMTAAFAAKAGAAPQSVTTGESYAVFRVADIKPAHAPSFEEYKSHILDDYRAAQAPALLNQKAQDLAAKAKSGNLQQAAKDTGATFKTSDLVGQSAAVPDIGSIADNATGIFALAQGQIGGPFTGGRAVYVVKIDEKQEPTPEDLASHFDATKDKMLGDKRERVFAVFVGNLMDRYKAEKRILLTKQATTAGSPFNQPS